jgi:hypothetical protein
MADVVQEVPPTVTPQVLINGALTAIGAKGAGEPVDPAVLPDAFQMLNDMLDMWSNEHLMIYYQTEIIQNIAGAVQWTIGLNGGQINVPRPIRINSGFVRIINALAGTLDYPVRIINLEQYEPIGLKSLPGAWARVCYYQPTYPIGNLYFWPLAPVGEIHLFADTLLTLFGTVNDTVLLPQGYNMAIRWNLASLLMPSYGRNDPAIINKVEKFAAASKNWIKRTNRLPPQTVNFDIALLMRKRNDAGWFLDGGMGA